MPTQTVPPAPGPSPAPGGSRAELDLPQRLRGVDDQPDARGRAPRGQLPDRLDHAAVARDVRQRHELELGEVGPVPVEAGQVEASRRIHRQPDEAQPVPRRPR